MPTYKTPGVYVEEISTLPPSVAEVSTAIPAFIGYTEKGPSLARVNTLLEYEELFGTAKPRKFNVKTSSGDGPKTVEEISAVGTDTDLPDYLLYYCMSHYFQNGGGTCYVLSVGDYSKPPAKDDFLNGLRELEKEDEPTLILTTDAVRLSSADYYEVCGQVLNQCNKLGDRFAIFDVKEGAVDEFRDKIGTNHLMYAAAYHPYLKTSLNHQYLEDEVTIEGATGETAPAASATPAEGEGEGEGEAAPPPAAAPSGSGTSLASIKSVETGLYNKVKTALTDQRVILPPSAAMAGIYASVDRDRGVWKAPANVSLTSVIGPVEKINHEQQEGLNVDPTGGKSINAIREFTGKGTLVWGARTLAGNDNEWRYVSVRRLFNMIEESAQKSTAFAVFEPNDMTTWLKVKGMIEGYLYGLWEQGALAGPAPEASYFVNVGLGKTMTTQDILEGRMIVEIGVAAVRPAEFIILRFSHKLQEA